MAFINEYISDEDKCKYNLDAIDEQYSFGCRHSRSWTIDRGREIYLREVSGGGYENPHIGNWTFYWQGELIAFRMEIVKTGRGDNGHRWGHKKITRINIPDKLLDYREAIISDIRSALEVYKSDGVYSKAKIYELILDIIEE